MQNAQCIIRLRLLKNPNKFGFSLGLHYVDACGIEIRRRLLKNPNKFGFSLGLH